MASNRDKIIGFLIKYKWIIVPVIPFLFFVTVLLFLLPSRGQIVPGPNQNIPPSTPPNNSSLDVSSELQRGENEVVEPLESLEGFQKTEDLPDNTIRYSYVSSVEGRPNVIITDKGGQALFQSIITHPNFPTRISTFTKRYGQAKLIFKGSKFYGSDAQTYIYPEVGIALIAKPQTDQVLEQHVFIPMKVDEYIKKYGEDIPSYP